MHRLTDYLACSPIGEDLLHHLKGGSLRSPPTTNPRK